ncbi:probable 2-oxoglutarate-dependent dioxygenase AOP1 [Neltuma alba]|nr:probable 2-oxoglutarate-dependent dioxygenase AOP1 [Prosopis alba]
MLRGFKYLVPQNNENNLGLHAHTDVTYFTILHQNNVKGLQVKLKSGEWIDVDPSPCKFLFLAGDALKIWSNDRIQSCQHQIIVKEKKKRLSVGLFSFNNKKVQTQEELVDEDHPIRYKSFDHYEYITFRKNFPSQISSFLLLHDGRMTLNGKDKDK